MNQSRFEPLPGLDCCMFQRTESCALLVSSQKAMQTRKSTWSGIVHRQLHTGFSKACFTRVFERPFAEYFDVTFFCWKQQHERTEGIGDSYQLDLSCIQKHLRQYSLNDLKIQNQVQKIASMHHCYHSWVSQFTVDCFTCMLPRNDHNFLHSLQFHNRRRIFTTLFSPVASHRHQNLKR